MSSSSSSYMEAPKESMVKRYKFVWRILLISNLALGAYMFASARKKERTVGVSKVKTKAPEPEPVVQAETSIPEPVEDIVVSPPLTKPMIVREPIPAYQQKELFNWMLEQKRQTKPKNQEEEKMIDEDKAILEQFIGSDWVPNI